MDHHQTRYKETQDGHPRSSIIMSEHTPLESSDPIGRRDSH